MSVKEDLQAARDFLATQQWGQGGRGEGRRPEGFSYCAAEAIDRVLVEVPDPERSSRFDNAVTALEGSPSVTGFITSWNDQDGRTKDEVLALFDQVSEGL